MLPNKVDAFQASIRRSKLRRAALRPAAPRTVRPQLPFDNIKVKTTAEYCLQPNWLLRCFSFQCRCQTILSQLQQNALSVFDFFPISKPVVLIDW